MGIVWVNAGVKPTRVLNTVVCERVNGSTVCWITSTRDVLCRNTLLSSLEKKFSIQTKKIRGVRLFVYMVNRLHDNRWYWCIGEWKALIEVIAAGTAGTREFRPCDRT